MNEISAVYVVRDNPSHFLESLESVRFAAEIVIIDIGMTEECKKSIHKYQNLKIIAYPDVVTYVEQIREKTKEYATHDHILFMDPDEIIPPDLKDIILKEYKKYDYISMPRKNIIFGKWIAHSRWWPDYQVRLFKKKATVWPKILHAQPEVEGDGHFVDSQEQYAMIHYNYENITEYLSKMVRYAEAEAREITSRGGKFPLSQAIKESLQEFMSRFFAQRGYLDGTHGFVLAALQLMYKWLVFFYVWEGNKYQDIRNQEIIDSIRTFFFRGLYESNHWLREEKLTASKKVIRDKIVNILIKDEIT